MSFLSVRATEAIKPALAMAIVYGVSLHMSWTHSYWAGLAVAMIRTTTAGQSLNKGVLRMLGAVGAAVCALTFLSWSFQDRWLMLIILTVFIGICTYMLTGTKSTYFWFSVAYVCLILCVDSGDNSAHAFHMSVVRVGQTVLGVLVYTLVSVFLWPQTSEKGLEDAAAKLFSTQAALYKSCRNRLTGGVDNINPSSFLIQENQFLNQLQQALNGAVTDSYRVQEVRWYWQEFNSHSRDMMLTMERLRTSFPELKELNLSKILPNLDEFCSQLDMRFAQIERMLGRNTPEIRYQVMTLTTDKEQLAMLPPSDKAALSVSKSELDRLELISRTLYDTVAGIRGYAHQNLESDPDKQPTERLFIDPERLIAVVRVVMTLWITYILWILVDPAGHSTFVSLSVTISMGAAMAPMLPATSLFFPMLGGCIYSGLFYFLVMPQLSGFLQLGTAIFSFTFAIFYFFWKPQQGLSLVAAAATFLVLTNITNEQTYSFSAYANTSVCMLMCVCIIIACTYIPTSPRPEKIFLRLLNRFHKNCHFLLSRMALESNRKVGLIERLKITLCNNDQLKLPVKIGLWGTRIDHQIFPRNSSEQVQELVTALSELALRINAVLDAGEKTQGDHLVKELHDDIHAWWVLVEKEVGLWTAGSETWVKSYADMPDRLAESHTLLEMRSKELFDLKGKRTLNTQGYENFYRLLGSYRGLWKSGGEYMRISRKIDWGHWREERF